MGAANYHDAITVVGMNRIRAAYLEIAPDLEPYFVMGVHDDATGSAITMAVPPGTPSIVHLVAGTPTSSWSCNGVVAGAIAALALHPRSAGAEALSRSLAGARRRGRRHRCVRDAVARGQDPPGAAGPAADVPDAGRGDRPGA